MSDYADEIAQVCRLRGVAYSVASPAEEASIRKTIEDNNMESVLLEKAPKVAIYAPPISKSEPWDDAVNLALTYAEISFEVIWDEEVLAGRLHDYDWVHLHHEDFTGQYGKFYGSYRNALWYKQNKALNEATAKKSTPTTSLCQRRGWTSSPPNWTVTPPTAIVRRDWTTLRLLPSRTSRWS